MELVLTVAACITFPLICLALLVGMDRLEETLPASSADVAESPKPRLAPVGATSDAAPATPRTRSNPATEPRPAGAAMPAVAAAEASA